MGVANLEVRNISLLLRWWWKPYCQQDSLWAVVVSKIRGIQRQTQGPRIWTSRGSFFWQQLIKIKPIFNWCSSWRIGDGTTISFWYDTWSGTPLRSFRDGLPRPQHHTTSLRDAIPIQSLLAPQLDVTQIVFGDFEDELQWRWTIDGSYSANSVYKIMLSGGRIKWKYMSAWECKAPIKVKKFAFLVLKERILTHDLMERRGMSCDMRCVMCTSCLCETAIHLLFSCTYAMNVWSCVSALLGYQLVVLRESVQETWDESWRAWRRNGAQYRSEWLTRFLCTLWFIWRQRNEVIFRGRTMPAGVLAERIKEEGDLWLRYCMGKKSGRLR